MSQNNSNDKAAMLAKIEGINEVEGFDPTPFAVDYTDLETGEVRKRLPVMIQMAWFRMKYPEGRIAITVSPGKDCFVATAKVYPSYKDGAECYLAEATASRGYLADKPSVSPREWAQTAAVGIALRNAGFGLQFAMVPICGIRLTKGLTIISGSIFSGKSNHSKTEGRGFGFALFRAYFTLQCVFPL